MLDDREFVQWLEQIIENYGDRINFACHGLSINLVSMGRNAEEFTQLLKQSSQNGSVVGSHFNRVSKWHQQAIWRRGWQFV